MGGGTRHPNHQAWSQPTNFDRVRVNAPINNYHYLYQDIPHHRLKWGQQYRANAYTPTGINGYPMRPVLNQTLIHHERSGYSIQQVQQNPTNQNPSYPPYPYYITPQLCADQVKASPRSDSADINGNLMEHYQQFPNGSLNQLHMTCGASFNGGLQSQYPVMPSPQIQTFQPYSMMYEHQHTVPHTMPPPRAPQIGTIITNGGTQLGDPTEPYGFHPEPNSASPYTVVPSQTNYSQTNYSQPAYRNGQVNYDPATQFGNASPSSNHHNVHSNVQQSSQQICLTENKLEIIQQDAHRFVESFCPMLGEKPYCLPPIKRHMHPDKQLVLAMESEKRVLGSFERFFAEQQIPVFMLCHYPVSGFMQIFNYTTDHLDRDSPSYLAKSGKDTVTLLLLSHVFSVTVVTVSIISGNSDLAYIQRGVHKAGMYNKRCSDAVTRWLKFLGVRPEVRQVIAFPNLKRIMLHRIRKEKQFEQNFGSLCTLHVDDLPAPFEEEWATEAHRQVFSAWIQRKVLCHTPALSKGELHLVVGALLSPRLSKVDFVHDEKAISPIVESTHSSVPSEQTMEDVSQLKLTIDGLTKPFDKYMDEYVARYYPNWEKETYRVPPIHFNIQSFKNPSDYLQAMKESSSDQNICAPLGKKTEKSEACTMKEGCSTQCKMTGSENSPFMPPCRTFMMTATRNSYCNDQKGPNSDFQKSDSPSYASRGLPNGSISGMSPGNSCLEALQGVKVLSEVMTKDVRADEGENRVITVLEMLGRRYGPMFIICGYQYNNYLNKLREDMFSKEDAKRPIRAFGQTMRAEHDCLIFHKKYGAIIVCIKAVGDNFEDWSASEEQKIICTNKILEKAVKQLDREEAMIRHVTSDLKANLACHKLIALPNMTRESVDKALSADGNLTKTIKNSLNHGAEIFLCSDELPPQHRAGWDYNDENLWKKLKNWWKRVEDLFSGNKSGGITPQIYRQLIGRYCGLFSTVEVWSPANPRVEVRSTSEAVNVCAARFRKMILLPHQIKALCSNDKRVFIYGPPGSGKTLLLILKAKEWLLAGETVILINSRSGSLHGYPYAYGVFHRLQQMMKESKIYHDKLQMLNVDPLKFKVGDLSDVMPSSCIIMDEVNAASHDVIEHLSCLQVKKIWCAGLFEDDKPITAHSFSSHKMDVILRCPPIVQSLLKHTEQDVRLETPYKKNYQSSVLERNNSFMPKNSPSSENGKRSNSDPGTLKNCQNTSAEFRKEHVGNSPEFENRLKSLLDDERVKKLFVKEYDCPENLNMESETHIEPHYSSSLLNERLQEKFGNAQLQFKEAQKTRQLRANSLTNISSTTYSHFLWAAYSGKFKKLFPDSSCNKPNLALEAYDPESLNKRLMDKYNINPKKKEETQDTRELGTPTLTTQDQMCASELLNKTLIEKYGKRHVLNEEPEIENRLKNNELLLEKSLMKAKSLSDDGQDKKVLAEQVLQSHNANEDCNEILQYDCDSLNKRLEEKYSKKTAANEEANNVKQIESINASYYRYKAEISLPTDGPRPHIINHSFHSQPGNPTDCFECGNKLADFLEEMIIPDGMTALSRKNPGKIKKGHSLFLPPGNRQSGKTGDKIIFSNTSSIHSKSPTFSFGQKHVASLDPRALNWSDVLIVAREMPKDCGFVSTLRKRNIPVKILMNGQTSEIENSNTKKLFITSFKEVTGLERALIIFVSSESPNSQQQKCSTTDIPDIQLGQSLEHLIEDDRMVLWYVASRSLASLVLILP